MQDHPYGVLSESGVNLRGSPDRQLRPVDSNEAIYMHLYRHRRP